MKRLDQSGKDTQLWMCLVVKVKSSMLKSRDITLLTKVCIVKAMVFWAVMNRCESWTIKKAEHQRTDAFKLWCWRVFRIPWTARRSKQSVLKEINPEYLLEGQMLKLKLQHLPPDSKSWLIGEDRDAGKDWGQEEKRATEDKMVGWHHWLNGHEFEETLGDSEGQGRLECCSPWGHKSRTQFRDWVTTSVFVWFACMHACAHAHMCVPMCVCVCVSEKERQGYIFRN